MAAGDDLASRIAALSPARRQLLLRRIEARATGPRRGPREPADARLPLSAAQQRLWLAQVAHPGSVAYNVSVPVRIAGPLDVARLARSLGAIVDRHEALRSRFGESGGVPFVTFAPEGSFAMEVRDLRHVPVRARSALERKLVAQEVRRLVDLEEGPVVHAVLAYWAERLATLMLTVHHIVADNWSMGIFCRELDILYAAAVAGRPAALPPPPWRHGDRVEWERSQGRRLFDGQLAYWRAQLAGAPLRTELPTDLPRPSHPSFAGARVAVRLNAATTAALTALARRNDATLFMAALAGLTAVLHRYNGQDDVVVGTDVVNRPRPEAERTIGFFANQLALRTDLSGNPSATDLLSRVAHVCHGAFGHQDVPFQQVVRALHPRAGLGHLPLFQVKLGFLHYPPAELRLRGASVTPIPTEGTAKFDVELILWVEAGELRGFFEYGTDLFTAATIERLAVHFRELLAAMALDGSQRILDIRLAATPRRSAPELPATQRFPFET